MVQLCLSCIATRHSSLPLPKQDLGCWRSLQRHSCLLCNLRFLFTFSPHPSTAPLLQPHVVSHGLMSHKCHGSSLRQHRIHRYWLYIIFFYACNCKFSANDPLLGLRQCRAHFSSVFCSGKSRRAPKEGNLLYSMGSFTSNS